MPKITLVEDDGKLAALIQDFLVGAGFEVGADDYMQKPDDPKVLLAHIQMHLKPGKVQNDVLSNMFNDLKPLNNFKMLCLSIRK